MREEIVYVGSAVGSGRDASNPPGISVFRFDDELGTATAIQGVRDIDYADWLAIDVPRLRLYAASEVFHWNEGTVTAYDIDPSTGMLRYVNKQPSRGNTTCYLGLSGDGRFLAATNYAVSSPIERPDASITLFALEAGELQSPLDSVRHIETGAGGSRSHAHCAFFSTDSRLLFVTDLGLDRLIAYHVTDTGLVAAPELDGHFAAGSGPRLAALHPDGQTIFVLNEWRPGVSVFRCDGTTMESRTTLDMGYENSASPCGIVLSPDGRHLYATVRGVGEIVGYEVGGAFDIREIGRWKTDGERPWDARVSPSGRHLLVANEDADNVEVFRRDTASGQLQSSGSRIECAKPMCVKFLVP